MPGSKISPSVILQCYLLLTVKTALAVAKRTVRLPRWSEVHLLLGKTDVANFNENQQVTDITFLRKSIEASPNFYCSLPLTFFTVLPILSVSAFVFCQKGPIRQTNEELCYNTLIVWVKYRILPGNLSIAELKPISSTIWKSDPFLPGMSTVVAASP